MTFEPILNRSASITENIIDWFAMLGGANPISQSYLVVPLPVDVPATNPNLTFSELGIVFPNSSIGVKVKNVLPFLSPTVI